MPQRDVFSQVQVDVTAGNAPDGATPLDDTPFHVAILGNFSGRAGASPGASGAPPLADRRPRRIDRDDLDAVLGLVAPVLTLDLGGDAPVIISFVSLDDFHPDSMHARLPIFAALRDLRQQLADPRTFTQAAAGLQPSARESQETPRPGPSATPAADTLAGGSLLDEIVAAAPESTTRNSDRVASHPDSGGELATFLRRVVAPHLVPNADPRQPELLASVDAASTALLRLILAHPQFRDLEALWRGLDLLVRRIETGSSLRLAIIDASLAELAEATTNQPAEVHDGAIYRMLRDGARSLPDGAPWSLLLGLDPSATAGTADTEVALLDGLARVAAACGAPWVTAAPRAIALRQAGQPLPTGWDSLRRSPHGRWLGLAFPSVLLRLPYGREADECDGLPAFEELEPGTASQRSSAGAARRWCLRWCSALPLPAVAGPCGHPIT